MKQRVAILFTIIWLFAASHCALEYFHFDKHQHRQVFTHHHHHHENNNNSHQHSKHEHGEQCELANLIINSNKIQAKKLIMVLNLNTNLVIHILSNFPIFLDELQKQIITHDIFLKKDFNDATLLYSLQDAPNAPPLAS